MDSCHAVPHLQVRDTEVCELPAGHGGRHRTPFHPLPSGGGYRVTWKG